MAEAKFNEKMFYDCEGICLPHKMRTYLDVGSEDYKEADIDHKLFHLAYVVSHGYDLYGNICEDIGEHKDTYGSYEDIAKNSLLLYISYLRSGKESDESGLFIEKLPLKKIVTLLSRELLLRFEDDGVYYSFEECHYDYKDIMSSYDFVGDNGSIKEYENYIVSTLETEKKIILTEKRLKHINGWSIVADSINTDVYPSDKKYVYPGDDVFEYETKGAEKKLMLNIIPEPFTGNILRSKIVILSLNPGFVKHLNQDLPSMLNKETLNQFLSQRKASIKMDGSGIYKYEIEKIIGECYWVNKMKHLAKECYADGEQERIYDDMSILQYLGYFSEKYYSISKKADLPSQWLVRLIIRYLSSKENVSFLILRAKSEWEQIIDKDVWDKLLIQRRLIWKEKPTMGQDITPNNIGKDAYDRIVKALKD